MKFDGEKFTFEQGDEKDSLMARKMSKALGQIDTDETAVVRQKLDEFVSLNTAEPLSLEAGEMDLIKSALEDYQDEVDGAEFYGAGAAAASLVLREVKELEDPGSLPPPKQIGTGVIDNPIF